MPEPSPAFRVSSRSRRRRASAAGCVCVAAAAGIVLASAPSVAAGATQTAATAASPQAVQTSVQSGDRQAGLVAGEDARLIGVRAALARTPTGSDGLQAPFRISSDGAYTLVLTARPAPYTLGDLSKLEPQTLTLLPDKSLLIEENIVVADGATLTLGGGGPLTLRLDSEARIFTSIISLGGRLQLQGSAVSPLTITSWDPANTGPDTDLSDGRAYIRAVGGTVAVNYLHATDLGFWSGRTGGVALTGSNRPATGVIGRSPHDARLGARTQRAARKANAALLKAQVAARASGQPVPTAKTPASKPVAVTAPAAPIDGAAVAGQISNSVFTGNAFGLFISDAQGVHVNSSVVQASVADGVILHHFVTGVVIDRVTARDNGGNGFSLSRGVQAAVLSNDTASKNHKDGFLISGRPLANGPSAAGESSTPFGNNEIIAGVATDNQLAGVQLVSGHSETVQGTRISGDTEGIIVGSGATGAVLSGNTIYDRGKNGILIRDGSDATVIANTIVGGGNGIVLRNARAYLRNNVVSQASLHGISFVGAVAGSTAVDNNISGRGSSAIDLARSTNRHHVVLTANVTSGWKVVRGRASWTNSVFQPMNVTLAVLFGVIVLGSFRSRRRKRRLGFENHPYAMTRSLYSTQAPATIDLTDGNRTDAEEGVGLVTQSRT